MSHASYSFMAGILALTLISICAGCLSTGIGDTGYSNNSVTVNISHAAEPMEVSVLVTVYRITNMTQEKYTVVSAPATLGKGENVVAIPVRLDPGNYKLYIYVLSNGDRKTAVIRDIVV